jgi:hypothetical protein
LFSGPGRKDTIPQNSGKIEGLISTNYDTLSRVAILAANRLSMVR